MVNAKAEAIFLSCILSEVSFFLLSIKYYFVWLLHEALNIPNIRTESNNTYF